MKQIFIVLVSIGALLSCGKKGGGGGGGTPPPPPGPANFAKGADVSWVTEMEAAGKKFYTAASAEKECMELLKSLGMNSIRLRVWVNPTPAWNGVADVIAKAIRAKNLG